MIVNMIIFHISYTLAGLSENYWEVLAERRRIALEDALSIF